MQHLSLTKKGIIASIPEGDGAHVGDGHRLEHAVRGQALAVQGRSNLFSGRLQTFFTQIVCLQ